MTPERWAQIEEMFHLAAECEPENRASLLDQACSDDPELRREVEALLFGEEHAGDHLHAAVRGVLHDFGFPLKGETVSHYRILDGVDSGGMGLVYRAEDIKLGRRVALKFLPQDSSKDPGAIGRFEREARAASALEHSNICPIYEFGEHEGQPFLVMQLLEGQTLRELLSTAGAVKAPLELNRLLELALQILDGLDAAHRQGIIHRDIKPANIFVTSQGQVKILDFGLAKLAGASSATQDLQTNPNSESADGNSSPDGQMRETPDPFLSRTGMAMGTAGYMSPEQVRGEKLDARTDLFSLGLVLYEMATGQRAFQDDTAPVMHDVILRSKPVSARALNPKIPAKLEAILRKALEKDRGMRYQSAAELRRDLETLKRETEPRTLPHRWMLASAAVMVLLITGAIFWFARREATTSQPLPDLKLRQLTRNSEENHVTSGAISPDGKYLAYSDPKGIYVKLLETGEVQRLPEPEELRGKGTQWEIVSRWFPDSTRFLASAHPRTRDTTGATAWNSNGTSTWLFSILEGVPRKLRDNAYAYSISPDGSLISFGTNLGNSGDREIWFMDSNGEHAQKILEVGDEKAIRGFGWLPGGRRVGYISTDGWGDSLLTRDLDGGPLTTVLSPSEMKLVRDFNWLPDGRLVYSLADSEARVALSMCNFWTKRIDSRTGRVLEEAKQLTNWNGFCMISISATVDGKRLVFVEHADHPTINVADLTDSGMRILRQRHFTLSDSVDFSIGWTEDSKALILASNRSGQFRYYRESLDEETPRLLATPIRRGFSHRLTPDGKSILYLAGNWKGPPAPHPVMLVPLDGEPARELFAAKFFSNIICARAPSNLCAIAEPTDDGTLLIISRLDFAIGRGQELARFALDPKEKNWMIELSPDGTHIAILRSPAGPIYILSLRGQPTQEVPVMGHTNLETLNWDAMGIGFFVLNNSLGNTSVLHVDLHGNVSLLWNHTGNPGDAVIQSPDCHHLSIPDWVQTGNVWTMENF